MTDQEKRAAERVPVALRIRLRYDAVDQFISKFAVNISRGGMFLSSRNPKPPGTELYFEIRLADESLVIEGSGQVRWIREYDRSRPDDPHGMGIQFLELSETSAPVLERIIAHRRAMGEQDDHSIPEPRFFAPARGRSPDAPMKQVPEATPPPGPGAVGFGQGNAAEQRASAPWNAQQKASGQGNAAQHKASGQGNAADHEAEREGGREEDARLREELMRALTSSVQPARPQEPTRAPAGRATDPPAVRAAVARARTLTGGGARAGDGLDSELAALLDESSVPVEITVEAASRELAERLGGAPVQRRPGSSSPARQSRQSGPLATVRAAPTEPPHQAAAGGHLAQTSPATSQRPATREETLDEESEMPLVAALPEREPPFVDHEDAANRKVSAASSPDPATSGILKPII